MEISCKPFICAVSVTPTDDGRYQCKYTPDRPGFYRLEVTSKGIHLCGSPFSVQVLFLSKTPQQKRMVHICFWKDDMMQERQGEM